MPNSLYTYLIEIYLVSSPPAGTRILIFFLLVFFTISCSNSERKLFKPRNKYMEQVEQASDSAQIRHLPTFVLEEIFKIPKSFSVSTKSHLFPTLIILSIICCPSVLAARSSKVFKTCFLLKSKQGLEISSTCKIIS